MVVYDGPRALTDSARFQARASASARVISASVAGKTEARHVQGYGDRDNIKAISVTAAAISGWLAADFDGPTAMLDALAYLKLVLNPHDDVSLRRVINVPARGVGKASIERRQSVSSGDARLMR